ncbi:MAG: cytochrome c [Candidatus Tectomicrobia bacterium]|nr:cytochrome c [Candidatus Tectomicrobia bacterium]
MNIGEPEAAVKAYVARHHLSVPLLTGGYPAPPHDETGHTWHHPDAFLFRIPKHGGQASAPRDFRRHIPPFKEVLTDEEIWAILAYIKSRWPAAVRAKQE